MKEQNYFQALLCHLNLVKFHYILLCNIMKNKGKFDFFKELYYLTFPYEEVIRDLTISSQKRSQHSENLAEIFINIAPRL